MIKAVLQRAIETGGSTLRDFVNSDGKSGIPAGIYGVRQAQRTLRPLRRFGAEGSSGAARDVLLPELPEMTPGSSRISVGEMEAEIGV